MSASNLYPMDKDHYKTNCLNCFQNEEMKRQNMIARDKLYKGKPEIPSNDWKGWWTDFVGQPFFRSDLARCGRRTWTWRTWPRVPSSRRPPFGHRGDSSWAWGCERRRECRRHSARWAGRRRGAAGPAAATGPFALAAAAPRPPPGPSLTKVGQSGGASERGGSQLTAVAAERPSAEASSRGRCRQREGCLQGVLPLAPFFMCIIRALSFLW